ncbi:MAG: hypothetical protein ABI629_21530 [bacterium]
MAHPCVARITTAGVVTELGTPSPGSVPLYITLGPDGAMWFSESGANRLGRIARDGRITKFDLPDSDSYATGIVGRTDGRLFYGLFNLSQIGFTDLAASANSSCPSTLRCWAAAPAGGNLPAESPHTRSNPRSAVKSVDIIA